jgi:2-keto-4-pentenoate hydratase/2-oxohepta-3-ene-1,7-dioic acid hydratase in catechol pathway
MKIIRYAGEQEPRFGILRGDTVHAIKGDLFGDFDAGEAVCSLSEVELLAPVTPSTVACLASNYHGLCEELGRLAPKDPQVFLKPASSVIGPLSDIVYPQVSNQLSCGGELAVVMRREARHVPEEAVMDYVLGYTCANDVSALDLSSVDRFEVTRAKGYYTFCPLGPVIATDLDPWNLTLTSRFNGETLLDHSTSDMLFGVEQTISYITRFMGLSPFDAILMGTPRPEKAIFIGDVVEVEIDGIGILKNQIVAERRSEP